MRNRRILFLVEVAMFAAIGAVLSLPYLSVPLWVQGGSISFAMVPIFFMAFRWGLKGGLLTGLLIGLINSLIQPFIVHPVQYIMDYPLAFTVVGLAGIFAKNVQDSMKEGNAAKITAYVTSGALLGSILRFFSHYIGGIVFFASYAPEGVPVWLYSLTYNLGYMTPSFIISSLILSFVIYKQPSLIYFGNKQALNSV